MMRQVELVERVQSYAPDADEDLLNRAYIYAMKAHSQQKRASGDPYFSHPLEVAAILTELKFDASTIATALLHDTIEDTEATRAEIDEMFGSEIGALVEGLTKIKKLDLISTKAAQAENFRKLLIAISSDIRVLMVKLADRLHNMRTLEHMRPDKRVAISEETLEIYAPLAGRMGMQWMREELEDLCFRWSDPDAYKTVVDRLQEVRELNRGLISNIRESLEEKFNSAGLEVEIFGREKKPYSIWRKMDRKQLSLERLSDIFAFRVIAPTMLDCYTCLGIIHTSWRSVPGRYKDYISNPKQNDYRSIHTTIVGPGHQRVELQIRTKEMHDVAEFGVAAHASYKDSPSGKFTGNDSRAYQWLRRLLDTLHEGDNAEEILENTKLELFHDQVFCFTPKGTLIALPQGAIPIDFAYAVHTDVGNACVGCKINGRHAPLVTELRNGDEVEILLSDARTPPSVWERLAVTGKARSAIRRAARDALRRQYGELGRHILRSVFEGAGVAFKEDHLDAALPYLSHKTTDDIVVCVGRGELSATDVLRAAEPDHVAPEQKPTARLKPNRYKGPMDEGWFNLRKVMGLKFRLPMLSGGGQAQPETGVPIRGLKGDIAVRFAEGGAIPGERIVGIMTPGQGISIYPIHSPQLQKYDDEPDRWIDVTWDIDEDRQERFPAWMRVIAINAPGTLAQITQVIGEADANIDNLRMMRRAADFTELLIELEIWDITHLNKLLAGVRALKAVSQVERVYKEPQINDKSKS